MSTKQHDKQHDKQHADPAPPDPQLSALIGQNVLRVLGHPGELLRVQVRRLWEDRYRVNVFVGPDAASANLAHSFFLETNGDGAILASTPTITKRY